MQNHQNSGNPHKNKGLTSHPLHIQLPEYSFTLNNTSLQWDTEKGKMQIYGVDAGIFWLDPSLSYMFAPIVEEIGIDLFRLIVANSSSLGTQQDYDSMVANADSFEEGFAIWANTVAIAGWGRFTLLEFDKQTTHAVIQVENPWELAIQEKVPCDKRWGCPFTLGKIIGIFTHALGQGCWASDDFEFMPCGTNKVTLTLYSSDKTIDAELEKLRREKLTQHELDLENEIFNKTAELQKSNALLENIANLDFLTNLNNRRSLEQTLSTLKTEGSWKEYTLLFLDLDQFKIINDTCGHIAGDRLLTVISERLVTCIGREHFIARYGGDEFAILLKNNDIQSASKIANDIRHTVSTTQFEWDHKPYSINCSIGITPLKHITEEVDRALIAADNACYNAKRNGRNQIYISHKKNEAVQSQLLEMQWVHRIRDAIAHDQFEIHYQLIKPATNMDHFSLEALIRMRGEDDTLIMPFEFLPAAENYNAIFDIDCWVINHTFKLLYENKERIDKLESLAINLSGNTLSNPKLEMIIAESFSRYPIDPKKICFEVTETHMMMNIDVAKKLLSSVRKHGCSVSLDDFGAGMSSFGYLRDLPVDKIKIDGSFVKNMDESLVDYCFVESITNVARAMQIKTVAEFVENERIVELLEDIQVDYLQGYYIGKPQPWEKIFPN